MYLKLGIIKQYVWNKILFCLELLKHLIILIYLTSFLFISYNIHLNKMQFLDIQIFFFFCCCCFLVSFFLLLFLFMLFVCLFFLLFFFNFLFGVFRSTRELFTHLKPSPLPLKGYTFCQARHLWSWSNEGSLECHIYCDTDTGYPFKWLCSVAAGIEHSTFRFWGERSNPLRHRRCLFGFQSHYKTSIVYWYR